MQREQKLKKKLYATLETTVEILLINRENEVKKEYEEEISRMNKRINTLEKRVEKEFGAS